MSKPHEREQQHWKIKLKFEEDESHTEARAVLEMARHGRGHHVQGDDEHDTQEHQLVGTGRARRNPVDPNVPQVGEELAGARALADLSHQLLELASRGIEAWEGHHIDVFS